ncbi:unnamed protein product [Choristocarpus tenellus]
MQLIVRRLQPNPRWAFKRKRGDLASALSSLSANYTFGAVRDSDVDFFRTVLGSSGVVTDVEDLRPYNVDWMGKYRGKSPIALLPKTTGQVSRILRHCNEEKLAVVPQGGNTGLVGGSVPLGGEVVLSTSRINSIISFEPLSGVLVCEAGCILENLDAYLAEQGYAMPLDLGAKGSCQIGGNISTNAGGLRLIRYGSLHGSILGLEAVLANGTVLDLLSTARKNNTGYDLKQLFIGAEGTLGIVTRCAISVPQRSPAVNVALLACCSFDEVGELLVQARMRLGEILSAVEVMDAHTVQLTLTKCKEVRSPLAATHAFYVLVETSGSNMAHDTEKLDAFLEDAMEKGTVVDGVVAQDLAQAQSMWSLREHAPVAVNLHGHTYKYDVSVPIAEFYTLAEETRQRVKDFPQAEVVAYGHLGDGNLHLNIMTPTRNDQVLAALEPFVFEWVVARGGSISAEHGVGQHKREFLGLQQTVPVLAAMGAIKNVLDPNGIMNPFKVLPDSKV